MLALLFGLPVQYSHQPERDGEGTCFGHGRERHASHGESTRMAYRESGQNARKRPDVNARGIHQARADRCFQEKADDHQGGKQLQHRLELPRRAERLHALCVRNLLGRFVLSVLVALVHGIGEPLPSIVVPRGVPDPHQALDQRQMVQQPGAVPHSLEDVHDRRAHALLGGVWPALERDLPGDQELYADADGVQTADAQHEHQHVVDGHFVDLHDREAKEVANSHHDNKHDLHGHLLVVGSQVGNERAVRGLQDVDRHVHHPIHRRCEMQCGLPAAEHVLSR
mmetsp:Transcript_19316/g.57879  ORF Transcript_19316/g.57879 Transcript_19316/m.57879 type:complete len:282 (-) Transcript_19316:466-1311(-)